MVYTHNGQSPHLYKSYLVRFHSGHSDLWIHTPNGGDRVQHSMRCTNLLIELKGDVFVYPWDTNDIDMTVVFDLLSVKYYKNIENILINLR